MTGYNSTKAPKKTGKQSAKLKQVDRLVFTGDFLRPSIRGMVPTQHENIQWLYQVLQVPLAMATGLKSEIVHWDNNWINQSRIEKSTVEAIYKMMGQKPSIKSWPSILFADTLPGPVEDMFKNLFSGSFVIGFELPPYLVKFFDRHDIGFVDCSLSPVRFMDDLLVNVSSNIDTITEALSKHAVSEDLIRLQAGVISSNVAKQNPRPPRPNSLLVILQTSFDKAVVQGRRFTTVAEHMTALQSLAAQYNSVLIKEHPLEPQPAVRDRLLMAMPNARVTTDNFYRLVSHPNLKGVAALSSSCVLEADYFGKNGHYILPGFNADTLSVGTGKNYIDDILICPDFWRDILASSPCATTPKDGLRLPAKPNRFRQQLRAAWGYNQIDPDIAVDWAKAR